ncbi:MAG: hypothetical protein IJW92_06880 [Clostridia bacterium]|nr:hypothetical protein [Clostridia bacterium]
MNSASESEIFNPWKDRVSFPAVDPKKLILAFLALFLCSLEAALFPYEQFSLVVLVALFVYAVVIARMPSRVLVILLPAVAVSFFGGFSAGGFLLAMVIGTGCLAWLLTALKHWYLALAIFPMAFAVALAVTRDVTASLLVLSFLPAGILLAVATKKGRSRTSAVCFAEAGFLLVLLGVLAVWIWQACGSLSPSAISAYLEQLRGELVDLCIFVRDELLNIWRQSAETASESAAVFASLIEQVQSAYSDAYFTSLVSLVFNILPGILTVACGILAFEAQLFLNSAYSYCDWRDVLTPNACVFTMSLPASILYAVSFFVVYFMSMTSSSGSLILALLENVCLILLPGCCVVGVGAIAGQLRLVRGGARTFMIVLLVFTACCASNLVLYLLALWGAYSTVLSFFQRKRREKRMENGEDTDDDGSHDA